MEIIREVTLREYQPKLLEWAMTISEANKKVSHHNSYNLALPMIPNFNLFQGLNVIKSVIDLKGMKRFKRTEVDQTVQNIGSPTDFNVVIRDANHAKEIMRKM